MNKPLQRTLVKTAHTKQRFTEKDLRDIQLCINDPHYFLNNFFYIQHPTKGKMQYKAYPYQTNLIDSYHNNRFSINMLGRQMGKCVKGETNICIMNKITKAKYNLPIKKLYEYEHAKKYNLPLPDISQYEEKDLSI